MIKIRKNVWSSPGIPELCIGKIILVERDPHFVKIFFHPLEIFMQPSSAMMVSTVEYFTLLHLPDHEIDLLVTFRIPLALEPFKITVSWLTE